MNWKIQNFDWLLAKLNKQTNKNTNQNKKKPTTKPRKEHKHTNHKEHKISYTFISFDSVMHREERNAVNLYTLKL